MTTFQIQSCIALNVQSRTPQPNISNLPHIPRFAKLSHTNFSNVLDTYNKSPLKLKHWNIFILYQGQRYILVPCGNNFIFQGSFRNESEFMVFLTQGASFAKIQKAVWQDSGMFFRKLTCNESSGFSWSQYCCSYLAGQHFIEI